MTNPRYFGKFEVFVYASQNAGTSKRERTFFKVGSRPRANRETDRARRKNFIKLRERIYCAAEESSAALYNLSRIIAAGKNKGTRRDAQSGF